MKTSNGGTSSLYKHMEAKHQIIVPRKRDLSNPGNSIEPRRQKLLSECFDQKLPFVAYMARLCVVSKIPFIRHTQPEFHQIYKAMGYQERVIYSANTVRSKILGYADKVRSSIREELIDYTKESVVSITTDEWTSTANRRYINVNVHLKDRHINLGLFRIFGSATAEVCASKITEIMNDHGVDMEKNVAGVTSDGAPVMVKMGNNIFILFYLNLI